MFTTYSSLYLAKDNDLLLSLPIPVRYPDRRPAAGACYLMGLMYSGVVVAAGHHRLLGDGLCQLRCTPLVGRSADRAADLRCSCMAVSCLLGWVVAKISLKLKNKSFVTVVLSLVFFGLCVLLLLLQGRPLCVTELLQNVARLWRQGPLGRGLPACTCFGQSAAPAIPWPCCV